jgi:outer membrane protein insertion porin family/translocation and assembly module TamA
VVDQADRRHPEQRRATHGALSSPPRCASRAALAALLFLGAGVAGAQASKSSGAPRGDSTPAQRRLARPRVTDVLFQGVARDDRAALRNGLSTIASHCKSILLTPFCLVSKSHLFYEKDYLDRTELSSDILRIQIYYWQRGYRDAVADTIVSPPAAPEVKVTFVVHRGPATIVSTLTAVPESLFAPRQWKRLLRVRVGAPINLFTLDSTHASILTALWRRGYADATVDTAIMSDTVTYDTSAIDTAAVRFTAVPRKKAIVGGIHVSGNVHIDSVTIRHGLSLQPGHLLLHDDVDRSQRALYESNLFRRASITFAPDSLHPDSVKQIQVTVTEAPLRSVQGTIGLTQINFLQVGGQYTNYNFLGNARQLTLNATVGNLFATALDNHVPFYDVAGLAQRDDPLNTGKYLQPTYELGVGVLQPWLGSPENSAAGGLFDHRRSFPGVYVDNGYGVQGSFTRRLADRLRASLAYRYELTQVSASQVYFCVNYGACDAPTLGLLQGRHALSPVTLSGTWDATDGSLSPHRGAIVKVELQHASQYTLSDYRYDRAFASASVYRPLPGRSVLAFHAEAGWVGAIHGGIDTGALHPRTRFYVGGAQSVRGFPENQLGPEVLTISDSVLATVCGLPIDPATCNPNGTYVSGGKTLKIPNSAFTPRPLGGNRYVEGSVEWRYPIIGPIGGAAFVDAGVVGQNTLNFATSGQSAITPGAGLRYYSAVGPIRLDLGYNPAGARAIPVVTQVNTGRAATIVELSTVRQAFRPPGIFNVLALHLSIGQAF